MSGTILHDHPAATSRSALWDEPTSQVRLPAASLRRECVVLRVDAPLRVVRVRSHDAWKAKITEADAYLMFAHTSATAGRGSIRLSYTARQLVENTRDHRPMPTALCLMGNPYVAWELAMLPTVIACYANSDDIQRQLAACMLGSSSFVGRLPVQLPAIV